MIVPGVTEKSWENSMPGISTSAIAATWMKQRWRCARSASRPTSEMPFGDPGALAEGLRQLGARNVAVPGQGDVLQISD